MNRYTYFFENPGEVMQRNCLVCDSVCLVKRDQLGPTSWAGAVAKVSTPHDYFYCPHQDEDWHKQALELLLAIEKTPSKRMAGMMEQELSDLIRKNLPEA